MPRRQHTQSFDDYERESAESQLGPIALATEKYLASKPGTEERLRLSGLVVEAMRGPRAEAVGTGDER